MNYNQRDLICILFFLGIVFLIDVRIGLIFSFIALLFEIVNKMKEKEKFTYLPQQQFAQTYYPDSSCSDSYSVESINAKFITPANPKTLIPVQITDPMYSLVPPIQLNSSSVSNEQFDDDEQITGVYNWDNFKYQIEPDEPNQLNVYDPRFTGYGDASRAYIEPITGQPRFLYDDINAVKMPNYITKNKLDSFNFADTYGPMQDLGKSLDEVRIIAENKFAYDTEQFRTGLTETMMRKNNEIALQRKLAPKRTLW